MQAGMVVLSHRSSETQALPYPFPVPWDMTLVLVIRVAAKALVIASESQAPGWKREEGAKRPQ